MFSLNHSQNTLKQVKVTVTLPSTNKTYTGNPRNEIIEVFPPYAVYSIKNAQGSLIKIGRGNATLTGTELNMGVNNGANASYSIHPLGDENYTYVLDSQQFVTGTLTITAATLTATTRSGSATYNGLNQLVAVISGINGTTYTGLLTASGTNVGSYTTTITGTGNYTGNVIGTLTIGASTITIASSGLTSFSYNGSSRTVGYTVSGVYAADTNYAVSGTSSTNAGNYTATLSKTSSNYVLGTTTTIPWTITKAVLTLTTGNNSMIYGSSVPTQSFGYSLSGLLGGDTTSVITGSATATHSTAATSSSSVGSYPIITNISGLSATNYTFSSVNGTLTINPATLTATTRSGSATYNGLTQLVTVISGINGTYSGSASVSGRDVGLHSTTIVGIGNYTGNVTGTLTITRPLTASTTSVNVTYNRANQSFTISGITGTYSGNPTVSGITVGSYTTTIYGTGYYTGYVTGTLNIYQDSGYIEIFYGGVYDAGYPSGVVVPVRTANAAFSVISSTVSGDAYHASSGYGGPYNWMQEANPPGSYVRNTNPNTQGFVVYITASITDPNYTSMTATTSVTFNPYVAPYSGGGFISE
jgi:hypothetical protein